jgi:hypothetical protein
MWSVKEEKQKTETGATSLQKLSRLYSPVLTLFSRVNYNCTALAYSRPAIVIVIGLGLQYKVKVKVKQSRYRPGVAQRVPGS